MGDRFRDFDAAWAERELQPLRLKLFDKEYLLPATIPASLAIRAVRLDAEIKEGKRDEKSKMRVDELEETATSLFGEETFQEWLSKGIDLEQLGEVIEWTLSQYGGTEDEGKEDPEADDEGGGGTPAEGEVQAPEGGPASPPSSSDGISSSQTSSVSTEPASATG